MYLLAIGDMRCLFCRYELLQCLLSSLVNGGLTHAFVDDSKIETKQAQQQIKELKDLEN